MTITAEPITAEPITVKPLVHDPAGAAPIPGVSVCLSDLEDVVAWLRGMAPDAVCGVPHSAHQCPLARYLDERNGHPDWEASVGGLGYVVGEYSLIMPFWARRFVQGVDALPARTGRKPSNGVTAAEALGLLETVRRLQPVDAEWGDV